MKNGRGDDRGAIKKEREFYKREEQRRKKLEKRMKDLERCGEELEKDMTKHALYRPPRNLSELLARWRPESDKLN